MGKYVPAVYPQPGGISTPPGLVVTPTSLPVGVVDTAYPPTAFVASGGTAPYSWSLVDPYDTLPSGMLFVDGVLYGTPTSPGVFAIQVSVTDGASSTASSGVLSLVISAAPGAALEVTTTGVGSFTRGVSATRTLYAAGGTAPYTWAVQSGTLPTGLNLDTNTGVISGTPTVVTTGTAIVVRATDAVSATADSGTLILVVDQVADPAITTSLTLPRAEQNVAYSYALSASGGWPPYTWAEIGSGLTGSGLSMSSGGVLSGTPNFIDTYVFTVLVTDSEGRTATRTHTVAVDAEGTVEGPHDFFAYWAAQSNAIVKYTMRSLSDLAAVGQNRWAEYWTYDFAGDTYANKQDAAKLYATAYGTIGTDGLPSTSWNVPGGQLVFKIRHNGIVPRTKILIILDWYYPDAFPALCGGVTSYKQYQPIMEGHGWGTIMYHPGPMRRAVNPFPVSAGCATGHDWRVPGRDPIRNPGLMANGMTDGEPILPTGEGAWEMSAATDSGYVLPHSQWIREWIEFSHDMPASAFTSWNAFTGEVVQDNPNRANGLWVMTSRWVATETTPARRLLYQVPLSPSALWTNPYIDSFKIELNSSKSGATGPLFGYLRNVLVLLDQDADESNADLFAQPVR